MNKGLRVFVVLAALLLAACTVDAGEGLMEATYNGDKPLSKTINVEIEEEVLYVQFIVDAQFKQGSSSVYVYDPEGQGETLALGATRATEFLEYNNPIPGNWLLVIHVDGNSETVVEGSLRLALKKR